MLKIRVFASKRFLFWNMPRFKGTKFRIYLTSSRRIQRELKGVKAITLFICKAIGF